jgi:hypothetical protein
MKLSTFQRLFLVAIALVCAKSSWTQNPPGQTDSKRSAFAMGPKYILMPDNFFVLVRKGGELGAFRLTGIQQGEDGLGTAKYESFLQADGSSSFRKSNVIKREGEIEIKPMTGILHSLTWQPGQNKLWVGKWWFGCFSPSLVNMSSHFSEQDDGYEFAPTSAQNVSEIDSSDKRLKWFRFDPNNRVSVPIADLPK